MSNADPIATMRRWLDGEPVWSYAKIIEEWGSDFEMYRHRWSREFKESMKTGAFALPAPANIDGRLECLANQQRTRSRYIHEFGFAIPCAELFAEMAMHRHGIVDVGAGTGYMTRLMRNRGIDVIGSDYECNGLSGHGFCVGAHDPDQVKAHAKTMVRRHRDRIVFCSWPTYRATWFRQMLKAMQIGQRLVVIREESCAEATAWQYLDDCFEDVETINIPAFDFMNDYASVHVKKRHV